MRAIVGAVGGLVAWIAVATIGNLALRALLPGYADVEKNMAFTLEMQLARLGVGALASLGAGWAAARIARGRGAVWVVVLVLVALFVPVHYGLWERFPLWYHAAFFASLLVAVPAGATLVRREVV